MSDAAGPGLDRGFVLHAYAYRETSLILQVFTEHHGRLGIVARGARRPKSANRSLLVPFQPLTLAWFGRGELKTLKTAESAAPGLPLVGAALLAAFYLNELLLKLTHRDDPHEGLFAAYDAAIGELRALRRTRDRPELGRSELGVRPLIPLEAKAPAGISGLTPNSSPVEPVLRRFEMRLLRELGYALELAVEAGGRVPIAAEREYDYVVERGAIAVLEGEPARANAVRLRGLTLLGLERGQCDDPATATQAKHLMRHILNHFLDGQELATRALMRDLQRLGEDASP